MARGALSRAGRRARRRLNQALAPKPPKAGETRDNVTYGETMQLGGRAESAESKTSSAKATTGDKS